MLFFLLYFQVYSYSYSIIFYNFYLYMWGNILTEVSYMQNFNMGFSNNKSDVLIHLTQ